MCRRKSRKARFKVNEEPFLLVFQNHLAEGLELKSSNRGVGAAWMPEQQPGVSPDRGPAGAGGRSCPVCGRVVATGCDLKRHMLTHTGEQPFECPCCGTRFARAFSYKRHAIKIHGFDPTHVGPGATKLEQH